MPQSSESLQWHVGEEQYLVNLPATKTNTDLTIDSARLKSEIQVVRLIARALVIVASMFTAIAGYAPTLEQSAQHTVQREIQEILALAGHSAPDQSPMLPEVVPELLEYDRSFVRNVAQKCCGDQESDMEAASWSPAFYHKSDLSSRNTTLVDQSSRTANATWKSDEQVLSVDVFDVSVSEFEIGWNKYLDQTGLTISSTGLTNQ